MGRNLCACTTCHFVAMATFDGEYLTSLNVEVGWTLVMSYTPSKLLAFAEKEDGVVNMSVVLLTNAQHEHAIYIPICKCDPYHICLK